MELNGREIHFRRTVLATCEIADMCPGGDINRLLELFQSSYSTSQTACAKFMYYLHKGYEMTQAVSKGEKADPVPIEAFLLMDMDDFGTLFHEALDVYTNDAKQTVEVAEPKKTGKKTVKSNA